MNDQKKLLVLVDGSERSIQTLQYMGQMLPLRNFKLVVFHVFSGVSEGFRDLERTPHNAHTLRQMMAWESQRKKDIDNFTQNVRQTLVDAGFPEDAVTIKIQNSQTGIARDILKEASDGAYTAVVLRRRGSGALKGIAVGSIANKLFSKLTVCPLIIAGPHPTKKKLLIAFDGSPSANRAVDFVAQNIGGFGYTVGLIHVIRGFGSLAPENPDFLISPEIVDLAYTEMMETFSDAKEKLKKAGFDENKISEKITTGVYSRAGTIIQEAQDGGYGTIVIGRKGLSRVHEFFMGRVCTKIIQSDKKFSVWVI